MSIKLQCVDSVNCSLISNGAYYPAVNIGAGEFEILNERGEIVRVIERQKDILSGDDGSRFIISVL